MNTETHGTHTEDRRLNDGRGRTVYTARCECGWFGEVTTDRSKASAEASAHGNEARGWDAITGEATR